jgi:hypothetical protein
LKYLIFSITLFKFLPQIDNQKSKNTINQTNKNAQMKDENIEIKAAADTIPKIIRKVKKKEIIEDTKMAKRMPKKGN